MNEEQIVMNMISSAGNARSHFLKALKFYKKDKVEEAIKEMDLGNDSIIQAHKIQTELIQNEVRGEHVEISLFMIHAQDHLMCALAIRDLVNVLLENE